MAKTIVEHIAEWKEQLTNSPGDAINNEHPDVTRAFLAIYVAESFIQGMVWLHKDAKANSSDDVTKEYAILPEHLYDGLSDIVARALENAGKKHFPMSASDKAFFWPNATAGG
jgi:hypothetical protein